MLIFVNWGSNLLALKVIKYPKKWDIDGHAGIEWLRTFMKRHKRKISLRKPEATSLGRSTAFNRHTVSEFFENLDKVHEKYG